MESFSIKKRLKSFTYAWKGIRGFVCREHNVWIHLTIAMLVIIAGFIFEVRMGSNYYLHRGCYRGRSIQYSYRATREFSIS